ncbi:DUF5655 domain-containing protein [Hyphomicrobium sp.]|uniref:DUF5655 domain-containing protein n=1 Tax=Hyphomicrobium sp. TaxID=82 RepID=UPI002E32FD4B|nr:DUF5655 domain-containing protein [Hyphomicrobium sp.]HEX2843536.1 DUF5655 domain-containing protein [Hyphomicrobium sp.]
MSTDYGEKERQFLETLKADTGRTLEEWMAAIAAQGLTHRNDIIDWLRRQGFMFSKASWIERIHNNGGRPIYDGVERPSARPRPRNPGSPRLPLVPAVEPPPPQPAVPAPLPRPPTLTPSPPPSRSPAAPQTDATALDALLTKAKAFRPLAVYVLTEVRKAVPGVVAAPLDSAIVFSVGTASFAVLTISAKELRLGLDLKSKPADVPLETAKLAIRGAAPMSHLIALTDARQITPALMAAVAQAAAGR